MCLLIVKQKGNVRPSWDKISAGWSANEDGGGVAWTKGDGFVSFKKFLEYKDYKRFLNSEAEFVGKEQEYSIMYHFRMATHGSVKLQNIHPFVLSDSERDIVKTEGKARSVVAHNGIITNVGVDHHIDFSDSMIFIRDYLSNKVIRENLENDAIQGMLEKFIGYSKIAILDGTGKFTFINRHMGIDEKDGNWYSNNGYKPQAWAPHHTNYKNYKANELDRYAGYSNDDDFEYGKYQKYADMENEEIALCNKPYQSRKNTPYKSSHSYKKLLDSGKCCGYCFITPLNGVLRNDVYTGVELCSDCYSQYSEG